MNFHLEELTLVVGLLLHAQTPVSVETLACMARTIHTEARGETQEGQTAVAHVVLNRVNDPSWPDDVCSVVMEPNQFAYEAAPEDLHQYQDTLLLALDVLTGRRADPTQGSHYFFSSNIGTPPWARKLEVITTIGGHKFLRRTE